jgi:filamentous hemagglutinin
MSGAQVTVGSQTTDTRQASLIDSNGKVVSSDTQKTHRALGKADVVGLQQQAQQKQSDNMLLLNTVTAFTDEAYRTMYQAGAQLYRVPAGCNDKSCAVPLSQQEALALKASQDGKVHIANNGIFNDLDGAVKYAQQHGGTINPDGSKDYSTKPDNQYIIFAPQSNNVLSELIVAGVAKSGLTPLVGLTNAEQQTANLIQQATQQGQSLVFDNHSRGTLTTDNGMQSLNKQGGIRDAQGNLLTPDIQMNNYGGAQNLTTGNQTLQQLTGNTNAQINSVIHIQDLVGASMLVGNNPTTPTYTSTAADGTQSVVKALNDGRGFFGNLGNILTGTATPHNCYGTAGTTAGCDRQWDNLPESRSPRITNPGYKSPAVIFYYPQLDLVTSQVQKDSNAGMNQLLQPRVPVLFPIAPNTPFNSSLEVLQNIKQGK